MDDTGPARAKMPSAVMDTGLWSMDAPPMECLCEWRDDWEPYELPGGLSIEDEAVCFESLPPFSLSLCRRRPKNLPAEDCRPLPSIPIARFCAQCSRPGARRPTSAPFPSVQVHYRHSRTLAARGKRWQAVTAVQCTSPARVRGFCFWGVEVIGNPFEGRGGGGLCGGQCGCRSVAGSCRVLAPPPEERSAPQRPTGPGWVDK